MGFIQFLNLRTIATMGSALAVAVFFIHACAFSDEPVHLSVYVGYRLLYIGETLFHELGHTICFWLFGTPAFPSIMTLYGSDLAGGVTRAGSHSWILQVVVWAALMYGCVLLYKNESLYFWPAFLGLAVAIVASFTVFSKEIPLYMGNGGSLLAGGVLLYRGWSDSMMRSGAERWFNALFGFFIVLDNAVFCYKLLYVQSFRDDYETHGLAGDFIVMTDYMPHWRVDGIAKFTLAYAAFTLLVSFALAAYFYEDEEYE